MKPPTHTQLNAASHHRLKPGNFVRLKDQPSDLPDFVLERYLGTFCWIRQQAWGKVTWIVYVARSEPTLNNLRSSIYIEGRCSGLPFALRSTKHGH